MIWAAKERRRGAQRREMALEMGTEQKRNAAAMESGVCPVVSPEAW